jgi:prephenate dehydrogenase
VHLLGRALASLNLEKQEISTPDYESLLNISSLVNNDTWQLFFDMQRYNPYAEEMRRTLRASLDDLETRISESRND